MVNVKLTEEINFTIKQITHFKEIIKSYSEAQTQNKHVKKQTDYERKKNTFREIKNYPPN